MLLTEFDEKAYKRSVYRDGFEDGEMEGERRLLFAQIQKKLAKGKSVEEIADELEQDVDTITEIIEKMCDHKEDSGK